MKEHKLDVPVAIIFFNRPETLKQVFKKVKEARPSKLFLIQDGARDNYDSDLDKIKQCRNIVNDIDWNCEVFKNYSDVNLGCGIRPYKGINWVFKHVDKAIILEDDCVPANSFFQFCEEMLEKYEDDFRIGIISGFNYFGNYDFGGYSYGFVKSGSIWGWATWKDRWDKYDFNMNKIKDNYVRKKLELDITPKFAAKKRIETWDKAKLEIDEGNEVSFWDYQWGFTRHLQSWLSIVPKYNLITNIGIGTEATHSGSNINLLSPIIAKFFFSDTKELDFPLKHPDFVLADRNYDTQYYSIIYPNFITKIYGKIYYLLKNYIKFKK